MSIGILRSHTEPLRPPVAEVGAEVGVGIDASAGAELAGVSAACVLWIIIHCFCVDIPVLMFHIKLINLHLRTAVQQGILLPLRKTTCLHLVHTPTNLSTSAFRHLAEWYLGRCHRTVRSGLTVWNESLLGKWSYKSLCGRLSSFSVPAIFESLLSFLCLSFAFCTN